MPNRPSFLDTLDRTLGGCLLKLFSLPFLLLGLWITFSMVQGLYIGSTFDHWQRAEGTFHRQSQWLSFGPDFEVSYEVAGRTYRTDRISYGAVDKRNSRFLDDLEDGEPVELWLDPNAPERATLVATDPQTTSIVLALGLALLMIGGFLFFRRAKISEFEPD